MNEHGVLLDALLYILSLSIGITSYFLNRSFKRIDAMEDGIDTEKERGSKRDIEIGIMAKDIENKHQYLNEKIDTINTNVKELIVEIKILAREISERNTTR